VRKRNQTARLNGDQEVFNFFQEEAFEPSTSLGCNDLVRDFHIDKLTESELTEFVCHDGVGSLYSLLPSLAQLSEQNRWITLISPPKGLDEKLFALYGIDPSRVLLIHPKGKTQNISVMNKALKNGKSGIVIYWAVNVPLRFLAQWRKSVKQGKCIGVWVNTGGEESTSPSVAVTVNVIVESKYVKVRKIMDFGINVIQYSDTVLPKINLNSGYSKGNWVNVCGNQH